MLSPDSTLANNLLNELEKDDKKTKTIANRVDYDFFNYCSIYELKYPKQVLVCKDCKQRLEPDHRIGPKLL